MGNTPTATAVAGKFQSKDGAEPGAVPQLSGPGRAVGRCGRRAADQHDRRPRRS
jgi:hypothetical protein